MTRGHRCWLAVLLLAATVGLVGCSSATPAGESRLPPRPSELRLDQVDPCALLTREQFRQLGVRAGERAEDSDGLGSIACQWRNFPKEPDIHYLARLIVKRGADYALDSTTPTQVVTIDGFSAVQTTSPSGNPNDHCLLLVDVAQGQSLWVQWMTTSPDYPGLTHELACQQARDAGRLMLSNLRELSR